MSQGEIVRPADLGLGRANRTQLASDTAVRTLTRRTVPIAPR